ncbi:MAG: thiol reductant ABC exporter subunit CydC [Ktedonobacteraceae bacterium]
MNHLVIMRRLLRQMRPLLGWMGLAILLGLLTIGSGLGLMTLSAYLISAAALHPAFASIALAIVGVRVLGVIRGILRYLERIVAHETTFRLLTRLRVWFYQSLEPLVPARLMTLAKAGSVDYTSGDLLSRLVADIDTLQEFYIRVIAPPVVAILLGIIMWFVLGAFDKRFAMTLLAFYLLASAGVPLLTYLLCRKLGRQIIAARSALRMSMVDSIQGAADLLACNQDQAQMQKVRQLNEQLVRLQAGMAFTGGLREFLGNVLVDGCAWTMLFVAIPLVRTGQLSGVFLAVLVLAAIGSFEAIAPLATAAQHLGGSFKAGQRLFEVIDTLPMIREPASLSPVPAHYDLELRHLSFHYAYQGPDVLNDISFAIPQGHCVAVVGPSGAGKSTIASLLLRLWDYEQGSIQLGGYELRGYHQQDVHRLISVVEQNTHLFNATIRENLLIARPEASQAEIEEAARQASIHDVIEALPQGYDTLIGEQGLKLSGGERQRLAIARAILKDAPIMILDEPTANLDTCTEHEVLRAIHHLIEGRTTLMITHRLVGLERVDEILVMQSGRIRERGTQHELLQCEGLYWKLWQIQNQTVAAQG